ncbi:4a-hydroxytetrahydrobiopterin dehydratase [Aurantivibrio plasticivorans]
MTDSTDELLNQTCEACRIDAPRVTEEEATELHKQIPEWELVIDDGVKQLHRRYSFPDFASALAFTNEVAAIAEDEGHHPALLLEWGSVNVAWWSHKIRGLHKNDFVMAAKTDSLYNS